MFKLGPLFDFMERSKVLLPWIKDIVAPFIRF